MAKGDIDFIKFANWIALNHFGCCNESSGILYWHSESELKTGEEITTKELYDLYIKSTKKWQLQ